MEAAVSGDLDARARGGLESPKDMPKAEFGELVLGLLATLFTVAVAAGQRLSCTAARTSGAHKRAPRAQILLHGTLP